MKRLAFLYVMSTLCVLTLHAQLMYDVRTLRQKREAVKRGGYKKAYDALIKEANNMLASTPLSVMDKKHVARTGDMHDYMSLNYYAWPDSTKANGMPYITIDCKPNPAHAEYDYRNLVTVANRIEKLALAWFFSGDERYAYKAVEQIKVWFLNPATCMNPNMDYCQVVPGRDNDLGRSVLDGTCVAQIVNSASLLSSSRAFRKADQKQMKAWVDAFHSNIVECKGGRWCDGLANNIAVAYDYQRIMYWLYCGHRREARACMRSFAERRLSKQLAADGSQPLELKRPNAFNYSWYNLQWLTNVYVMASIQGIDIASDKLSNGASYYSAIDFLAPYVGKPRESWPYQETTAWPTVQNMAYRELYRISRTLNPGYSELGKVAEHDVYNLIY